MAADSEVRHVILGASGFLGHALARKLSGAGQQVVALSRRIEPASAAPRAGPVWIRGDAGDAATLTALLKPNDIVYALTGGAIPNPGQAHPRTQLDQTVGGLLTLLEVCREKRVARLLYPSSGGTVYGRPSYTPIAEDHPTDPISAYGVQKLAAEKYLAVYRRLHGLDSIVMRIGNPYGPGQDPHKGQGLIAAFAHRAMTGKSIEVWGDGTVVRDYLYIDDAADAMISLAHYTGLETLFNIGSSKGRSVNEIIELLRKILGAHAVNVIWRPARAFDTPTNVLNTDRIRRETGWSARTELEHGVRRQIDWIRSLETPSRE